MSAAARLVLYVAEGCHLCADALRAARAVAADPELDVALDVVDIGGDEALERAYRVELPVLELDGERVFRFEVPEDELRHELARRAGRFSRRAGTPPGRM